MNHTTASCGHPTIAVGAPGSPARGRCESEPCEACKPQFETFSQGSEFVCKEAFSFKVDGKGRTVNVKAGDRFWVENTQVNQQATGFIRLSRHGTNTGWNFPFAIVASNFERTGR